MSYNVYCFHGINEQLAVQRKIMEKNNAAVIGLQELSTSRHINAVGQAALADYPYKCLSVHSAVLGIASKYPLRIRKICDFRAQDPEDMRQFGQTRAYMMADMDIGGKTVTLINAHLCFLTKSVKYEQMRELLDVARGRERVIITGDFNCFMVSPNDAEYVAMYQPFVQAGFHLANCDGSITKTWTDKKAPRSLADFTYPTDNIITSTDIRIRKVYYDKTKLAYPNGRDDMDHIPVIALVEIK